MDNSAGKIAYGDAPNHEQSLNDMVQSKAPAAVSFEQVKRIARYELTFDKLDADFSEHNGDLVFSEDFSYSLDDLKQALVNIRRVNPDVFEFTECWLNPLKDYDESFGISNILWSEHDEDNVPDHLKEYVRWLPVSDNAQFRNIWWGICDAVDWYGEEESKNLSDIIDFDGLMDDLERYERNKGKPIGEWQFTREEKEGYIRHFDDDDFVKSATENQLALCRKFVEELCGEDCECAIRLKGYSCYGGNRLYPCDWNTSRDCMTNLFDKTDDPQYANTLGYIYYYGRCNGGVPEYDHAFYYFGIAAANGLYESSYKLADMFWHGYGCRKSPRTARTLYTMVYNDTYKRFLNGEDTSFADAALRMGNVFAKGIGEDKDPTMAYCHYLQADYAARLRAEESDFFGNTTVAINIQNALDEIKAKLPEDYFCKYEESYNPYYFKMLAEKGNCCELTRSEDLNRNIVLTAARVATKGNSDPGYLLITEPRIQYCERRQDVSYAIIGLSDLWFKGKAQTVKYNYCELNWEKARCEFYYDNKRVAFVKCDRFRLLAATKPEPSGAEFRLATVKFSKSGRSYDYICDFEDVKSGDTVIVEGYDGEAEVTVTKITARRESELGLPVDRYKKIIRKA